jgi:hypothetical protein
MRTKRYLPLGTKTKLEEGELAARARASRKQEERGGGDEKVGR